MCARSSPSARGRTRRSCSPRTTAGVSRLFRVGGAHADRRARLRHRQHPAGGQDRRARQRLRRGRQERSSRGDCAIDFYAGPSEIVVVSATGRADVDCRRPDRAGRARPRRARDPAHTLDAVLARRGCARRCCGRCRRRGRLARRWPQRRDRRSRERWTRRSRCASGWRPSTWCATRDAVARRLTRAGTIFVGDYSAQASGDYATGSNHVLPTSGAARARGGLSAADFVRVSTVQRLTQAGLRRIAPLPCRWRAPRGSRRMPHRFSSAAARNASDLRVRARDYALVRAAAAPEREHRRLLAGRDRGAAALTRQDLAIYPDYAAATEACARLFDVSIDSLLLTNGLDEGILAAAVAALRERARGFAVRGRRSWSRRSTCTRRAPMPRGGRVVEVPLGPGFAFPLDERPRGDHAAHADRLADQPEQSDRPGDPARMPSPASLRPPPSALVFVDEAYADFAPVSLLGNRSAQSATRT